MRNAQKKGVDGPEGDPVADFDPIHGRLADTSWVAVRLFGSSDTSNLEILHVLPPIRNSQEISPIPFHSHNFSGSLKTEVCLFRDFDTVIGIKTTKTGAEKDTSTARS